MKKRILGGIAIAAIALTMALNLNFNANNNSLSDISLANVEALAWPEIDGWDGISCNYGEPYFMGTILMWCYAGCDIRALREVYGIGTCN